MKCDRINTTLMFSAAFTGLALTVLTPAAYGHGNNPSAATKGTFNTPSSPPPPPPDGRAGNVADDTPGDQMHDAQESMLDPGIVIGIDLAGQDTFDVLSQVVSEPFAISMIVNPAVDLGPFAVDLPGGSVSGSITVPMSSVIPAPGTLALLGLAAASVGRRRRRS